MSKRDIQHVRTIHDETTECDDDICCCEPEPRWQRVREDMDREASGDDAEAEGARESAEESGGDSGDQRTGQ